jgi:hypothetical protein
MARLKQPLTRETYLAYSFGKNVPPKLDAEEELELPPQFRGADVVAPLDHDFAPGTSKDDAAKGAKADARKKIHLKKS